jgi:CHAT domain-containing protein
MQSRLLFAPQRDTVEDGLLHAYELYNLRLPADLAVLSACNTGFGRLQAGEGVMSLAHAFRYAGCRSIVMSLWPAEDESTAFIVERFYAHLAGGLPKDEALRLARLDYLDQADPLRAHPYYWTHLVAMGDMTPLRKNKSPSLWWIAGLGGVVVAVVGMYYYFSNVSSG